MRHTNESHFRSSTSGFTVVEICVAIVIFGLAITATITAMKMARRFNAEASVQNQQNAYSTFRARVALQGIDATKVSNPLQGAIKDVGSTGSAVSLSANDQRSNMTMIRGKLSTFEVGVASTPEGAGRNLAGSAKIQAFNYRTDTAAPQQGKGVGLGFGIQIAASALSSSATPLAPPTFNISGDITAASFPLNNIASFPNNPPGTVYRVTYDGTTPTAGSPVWNNDPAWTKSSFPGIVTLRAFNSDPQYSPSVAATTTYTMTANITFARADGRAVNLYSFGLADLSTPNSSGVVLSVNIPLTTIYYTLDGSAPTASSPSFSSAFVPPQGLFLPNVQLNVLAIPSDSRYIASALKTYTLTPQRTQLPAPVFVTDSADSLNPGDPVAISYSNPFGVPHTAINSLPDMSSTTALSISLF